MVSRVIPVDPFDLVVFGGTGDLARKKILPALHRRFRAGQIDGDVRIIGAARGEMDTGAYREMAAAAIRDAAAGGVDAAGLDAFVRMIDYAPVDAEGDGGWDRLAELARPGRIRAHYLSVAPRLFGPLAGRIVSHGLADEMARIVVEKPFGHDLASARELNAALAEHFRESMIFRIDHYLGKETVQNLMAIRFGNVLFEPLWNSQYVDHVQITVAEESGVGERGGYYDQSGAIRDMVQNHLMQLLCLIAMEPPSEFAPDAVRDEKLKVIRALDPVAPQDVVRGQYGAGDGKPGYREQVGNPSSATESFVALKARVSNWRWAGTPFFLRTGKRLRRRASEIAVAFKEAPHSIFGGAAGQRANVLSIRLQPDEGIELNVTIKEPGQGGMRLIDVPLDMTFADALGLGEGDFPDAYERLIMDVIRGNHTLFMRGDEVEAAWKWIDGVVAGFAESGEPLEYAPGGAGPDDALMLMHRDGRRWREIRS